MRKLKFIREINTCFRTVANILHLNNIHVFKEVNSEKKDVSPNSSSKLELKQKPTFCT